jgi:hypothetical protein
MILMRLVLLLIKKEKYSLAIGSNRKMKIHSSAGTNQNIMTKNQTISR